MKRLFLVEDDKLWTNGTYDLVILDVWLPDSSGFDFCRKIRRILGELWDCSDSYIDNNSLTVYIRRLRAKIEDNPEKPNRIVTVRGMGYKWNWR